MIQQVVGTKEMKETHMKVGDDGPGDHLQIPGESHTSNVPSLVGGKAEPGTTLELVDEYPKMQTLIRLKVLMLCTLCPYRTAYLTKRTARKRLYNHRRRKHPLDNNNNPKEVMHDASDEVIRKKGQTDHEESVPDSTDDEHETIPDTTGEEDSQDDSCVVVHGDEEKLREYERMSGDITWYWGGGCHRTC